VEVAVMVRALVEALGGRLEPAGGPGYDRLLASSVSDVFVDSRRASAGSVFAALPGLSVDGARFAADAVDAGARVVLSPEPLSRLDVAGLGERWANWIHPDARRVAGLAAALVHGRPSRAQRVAGATGTNGKTTVVHLIGELGRAAGWKPAVVGTVGYRLFGGEVREATHTTPDATELQRLLAANRDAGGDLFALEISSHALDQERAAGVELDAAVFTNLSRDHLDYHGSMDAYAAAKARLFAHLKPDGVAVVNADDEFAGVMLEAARAQGRRAVTYGIGSRVDLCVSRTSIDREGIFFCLTGMGIQREGIKLPLVGRHNVENAIAALAAVLVMGASSSRVLEGLATVSAPPGRLSTVDTGERGFGCYVDYAHTPDALARVLDAVRPLVADDGRLIVVFGCGGDRDTGKRAPMGAAAARGADVAIITSDNPRSEDPAAICAEVERGAREAEAASELVIEVDRRAAIGRALRLARAGDVVLIAGKGHETWQVSAGAKHPFDDRRVAAEELGA